MGGDGGYYSYGKHYVDENEGETVYVYENGKITALDSETGKVKWTKAE